MSINANPWDSDTVVAPASSGAGNPWDADPVVSGSPVQTGIRPTSNDAVNNALGLVDAGVAGANQLVVGTLGSVARTANRLLPDAVFGAGSKAQTQSDIDSLQNAITYHPQTEAGQRIAGAVSGAVAPVGQALAKTTGAVFGNQNTPAVMDALSVFGLKGASEFTGAVKGAVGIDGALGNASLGEARAADQAAQNAGLTTAGLSTGSPVAQSLEKTIAKVPGVGSWVKDALADSNTKLGLTSDQIVQNLTGGADTSAQSVGTVISDQVNKGLADARAATSKGYNAIQDLLPKGASIPVTSTLGVLRNLTKIDGASATADSLIPANIKSLYSSLEQDSGLSGKLPYDAVAKLRSAVGSQIDWSPFTSTPSNGMLKTVYSSLSKDLNAGASSFGSDVADAVNSNNAAYAKMAAARDSLQGVLGKAGGPEAVYNSLFNSTRGGSSTIDSVMRFTSPTAQRLLAGSVLERMGKATAGAQDASGSVFSADTFLSNWSRMSPEAKQSLFGSLPSDYAQSIDDLVHNVSALKSYGQLLAARSPALGALGSVIGGGAVVEAMAHQLIGFKTLGASYGASKALQLALTNPQTAKTLARMSTDLSQNAVKSVARVYGSQTQH